MNHSVLSRLQWIHFDANILEAMQRKKDCFGTCGHGLSQWDKWPSLCLHTSSTRLLSLPLVSAEGRPGSKGECCDDGGGEVGEKKPLRFARSVWTDKPQSPRGLKTVSLQYQRALKGSGTNFWKHPRGFFFLQLLSERVARISLQQ